MRTFALTALLLAACAHAPDQRVAELERRLDAFETWARAAQPPAESQPYRSLRAPAGIYLAGLDMSTLNPMRSILGPTQGLNCNNPSAACSAASFTTTGTGTFGQIVQTGSNTNTFAGPLQTSYGGGAQFVANSSAIGFSSAAASGTNAFQALTNGARFDFGAGASDYASSDGTTVSFAGPISVPTGVRLNWDGTTAGVSAFATDSNTLQFDNEITHIMGTSAATPAKLGGTVCLVSTGVGNLGASGPDPLQTCAIPASALVVATRGFRIKAWGTTANNANAKTVAIAWGSTTMVTKNLTASVAGSWEFEAYVLRTGTSAQDFYAFAKNNNGTALSATDGVTIFQQAAVGTSTQTESAGITVQTQSNTTTADNDIVSEGLLVEYL